MTRDLSRLFRPRSIAVFGGGAWGPAVVEQCQKMGFDGAIWPVHPSREEIRGLKCYRSVEDLPATPDASFIRVNRNLTIEVVERLAKRGAGGAVCFASGFKESDAEGTGVAAHDRHQLGAGNVLAEHLQILEALRDLGSAGRDRDGESR